MYMQSFKEGGNPKNYKLEITKATLVVPIKIMAPSFSLDLEKKLASTPLTYELNRKEIRKITIARGKMSITEQALCQSTINPDKIMIFFMPESIWEGDRTKTPLELLPTVGTGEAKASLTRATLSYNGTNLEQYSGTGSHEELKVGRINIIIGLSSFP